jgi:hypothetical protein
MDAVQNPYAPGAGTPPPELAGREELREAARVALARICAGKPSKSLLMVGLRGVGKTVLLDKMREDAEAAGLRTIVNWRWLHQLLIDWVGSPVIILLVGNFLLQRRPIINKNKIR